MNDLIQRSDGIAEFTGRVAAPSAIAKHLSENDITPYTLTAHSGRLLAFWAHEPFGGG
jgi:hypothetical protein